MRSRPKGRWESHFPRTSGNFLWEFTIFEFFSKLFHFLFHERRKKDEYFVFCLQVYAHLAPARWWVLMEERQVEIVESGNKRQILYFSFNFQGKNNSKMHKLIDIRTHQQTHSMRVRAAVCTPEANWLPLSFLGYNAPLERKFMLKFN